MFEARNSSRIDHLTRRHQCKLMFFIFLWNFGKSFENVKFRNLPTEKRWFNILENRWNSWKSWKIDEIFMFLTDSGEIVLLSLKIFFTDVSQKSFTTCRSNFNPKKQVFEARNSLRINHLDQCHQCKSIFSWNSKIVRNVTFSNLPTEKRWIKIFKIDEMYIFKIIV